MLTFLQTIVAVFLEREITASVNFVSFVYGTAYDRSNQRLEHDSNTKNKRPEEPGEIK
jgi:hypothetical protein